MRSGSELFIRVSFRVSFRVRVMHNDAFRIRVIHIRHAQGSGELDSLKFIDSVGNKILIVK